MAGHFPFGGKRGSRYGLAPRMSISAFFEHQGFNNDLQEKYYKWWYDWAKDFVSKDADLSVTMGLKFNNYPMGQHAEHGFHLNDKRWASALDELGAFISNLIFPKLDSDAMHKLDEAHHKILDELKAEAQNNPRPPSPDVGLYRHV
ncbi:MAG: hypothetical protein P8Y64_01965 [Gammaproteobacteria bacterium]|jgi:hypothetical protein